MKAFAIVKFIETNGVAIVPINWITNSECSWPPPKLRAQIIPHVEKGISASATWQQYPIQTLGLFGQYIYEF